MSVGENIRRYRKLRGMTQAQLAEAVGLTEGAVRHYESGIRAVKPELLESISAALVVSVNALKDYGVETAGDLMSLLVRLEDSFGIVPQHAIEKYGQAWTQPENFVGNGPFVLTEHVPQDRIVCEKNPLYWDAENVALDEVVFLASDDTATNYNMYVSGEVDWNTSIDLNNFDQISMRTDYQVAPQLSTYYYTINVTEPPFDDPLVRKAISYAIDREELVYSTPKGNRGRYFLIEKTMDFPSVSLGKEIFRGELSKNLKKEMNRLWGKNTALAIISSEYSRNTSTYMDRWSFEGMGTVLEFIQSISTSIDPQGMPGHSPVPYLQNIDHGWIERIDAAVLDAYEEAVSSFFIRLSSDIRDIRYERRVDGSSIEYRLMVTREIAGKERVIPFEDESSGIKKLLSLFPSLMSCALGSVTFIDELDSGIHDKMVRDLISQAMDAIGGQLVVTTHNTSLLETLDPRHVFVIRVDSEGYKEISSFNDIAKTQGNNNNRIRYGNGLFGGIPLIRDLDLKGIAEDLGRGADSA